MARQRGATNLAKRQFREALYKYCADRHVDPHYWMVDLLTKKRVPYVLKLQAAKELAQYLQPKLQSMKLSGDAEGDPVQFVLKVIQYGETDSDSPAV